MTLHGFIYRRTRDAWRAVAPGIKRVFASNSVLSKIALVAKRNLEARAAFDDLYDEAFYRDHKIGGEQIVASLQRRYDFASVIDVGCGSGEILSELQKIAISARGLERSKAALAICREQGLVVHDFDLESDAPLDWKSDLVISTEVAEHLPASCADRYVALMDGMAKNVIILTAATPGQGGTDHVNEQPYSYWIEKFDTLGWCYREDDTKWLRATWPALGVEPQRARNVMAFTRCPRSQRP
jgi:SAM-dependent methyltransferase